MLNKKNIIIGSLIIAFIAALLVSFYFLSLDKDEYQEVVTNVDRLIKSDMVEWSINLSGVISSVGEKEILVRHHNQELGLLDYLRVPIKEETPFYALVLSNEKPDDPERIMTTFLDADGGETYLIRKKIAFIDVRVGQSANIRIEFLDNKEWIPVKIEVFQEEVTRI